MSRFPFRFLPALVTALLAAVMAAACQVQPERTDPVPVEPIGEAPDEPEATVNRAVDLLQDGREDDASRVLRAVLDTGDSAVAESLLEQIEADPEELLGSESREIRVAPGESLSLLAARHLGDAMQFYALARYNDIDVPRRLEAGRVLRIPASADDAGPAAEAPVLVPDAGVRDRAQRRMAAGRPDEAVEVLLESPGALTPRAQDLLAEAAVETARRRTTRDQRAAAIGLLESARDRLTADDARTRVQRHLDGLRAREAFDEGRELEAAGEGESAQAAYDRALALDPELAAAREASRLLRRQRVESLHEAALTAWRDREVDEAISGWEQALAIDPEFEPAQVYLERALRLRQRLEEM